MTDTKFYVYAHYRPNGEIFYIGKGYGKRAWSKDRDNPYWHSIVKKHGDFVVEIIHDCLVEDFAFMLEMNYIACYGRKDLGGGPLANMTDGGDGGTSGAIQSKETRRKKSLALMGKPRTEETKLKISQALMGNKNCLGHYPSKESKEKMSLAQMGNKKCLGHIHSEESKRKMTHQKSKLWKVFTPSGEELIIRGLARFCRERKLGRRSLCRAAKNMTSYKGYTITKLPYLFFVVFCNPRNQGNL